MATTNPLISTQKSADTSLEIALHPLVLLTISDYITRHTLRQQKGPIVGALLGQQNGREVTIEHAFDCLLIEKDGDVILNEAWFEERLQNLKEVHKVPALELVGWYTILPVSGPSPAQLPVHQQIMEYNESSILLGFHPTAVLEGQAGGKLPITIYETNYETDDAPAPSSGEDKEMKDGESKLSLKFKELQYSVETGEAEMISVDFVARGGGNATAVDGTGKKQAKEDKEEGKIRWRGKVTNKSEGEKATKVDEQNVLSPEDEELIASLTAKANAIKMLHGRINLIAIYLKNLPPSFISNTSPSDDPETSGTQYTPVNHSMLRSIQALLSRLTLLIPADSRAFEQELISEQNDVNLISLLSTITTSIKDVREMGRKYGVIDAAKVSKNNGDRRGGQFGAWNSGISYGGGGVLGVGDLIG